jgi:asparagine synthase (glutamine-hydrolysing)
MGALIAVLNKKGEDVTETAVIMLRALSSGTKVFSVASPSCAKPEKTMNDLQRLRMNSHIIIGHTFSRVPPPGRPQPMQLKNRKMIFEGRIYLPKKALRTESFANQLRKEGERAAKTLIQKSSGDYTFVLAEPTKIVGGRDPVGVCPLYYGENERFAAFASERKALWEIGIHNDRSFPPGHLAIADQKGFSLEPIKTFSYSEPKPITIQDAAKELETLLERSVAQRVSGLKKVAIAFSGGLDSSIIAFLARKSRCDVHLIHVSLENQMETEHARRAAEVLRLPIHIRLFREENVEEDLPRVLWLIEEADPVKTSVGIPIYWVAEQAAHMGFRVMLAGQGADELFGGYRRYVDDYELHGEERLRRRMFQDIVEICEANLERDFKICNFHDVELRLPFAAFEMARFAADLPVNLKVHPQKDSLRKLVLRQAARNVGLPESISKKPKKALQYTTGVNKALKTLAKKEGVSMKSYLQRTFQKIFERTL